LDIRGIACERGGKTLFGPLDLTVDRGAALFVLGPNGSGKSTLLRTLAGLLEPLAGQAHWSGELVRVNAAAWRGRVAYLGHRLGHKDELTVAENLALASRLEGARHSADAHHAALARVGLEKLHAFAVKRLSQGQKQRLALARLCLSERPVWLLDEPSAALDAHAKGVLAAILDGHLRARGIALVATHETFELAAGRAANLRLA
jgi:heme exporter protein A